MPYNFFVERTMFLSFTILSFVALHTHNINGPFQCQQIARNMLHRFFLEGIFFVPCANLFFKSAIYNFQMNPSRLNGLAKANRTVMQMRPPHYRPDTVLSRKKLNIMRHTIVGGDIPLCGS